MGSTEDQEIAKAFARMAKAAFSVACDMRQLEKEVTGSKRYKQAGQPFDGEKGSAIWYKYNQRTTPN